MRTNTPDWMLGNTVYQSKQQLSTFNNKHCSTTLMWKCENSAREHVPRRKRTHIQTHTRTHCMQNSWCVHYISIQFSPVYALSHKPSCQTPSIKNWCFRANNTRERKVVVSLLMLLLCLRTSILRILYIVSAFFCFSSSTLLSTVIRTTYTHTILGTTSCRTRTQMLIERMSTARTPAASATFNYTHTHEYTKTYATQSDISIEFRFTFALPD